MPVVPAEKLQQPEQVPFPRFDELTEQGIAHYTESNLALARYHIDTIKNAHNDEDQPLTWENTVGELQNALEVIGYEGEGGRWPMLMAAVHPDKDVRKAAGSACGELHTSMLGMYADSGLYAVFTTFSESEAARSLRGEKALALAAAMKEFKMAGQELDTEARAKLLELNAQLVSLGAEFRGNMANDIKQGLVLNEAERQEVASHRIATFSPRDDSGNVIDPTDQRLALDKPNVDAALEQIPNRDLRRRIHETYNSIGAPHNQLVLAKIANTRLEIAETLGYRSWEDLQTDDQMLGSPEEVLASYEALQTQISAETEQLLADIKTRFNLDHDIEPYDIPYYVKQMRIELDAQISGFIPYENVLNGMFGIAKELFGTDVREITDHPDRHEGKWHHSVKFYEILDSDGTLLGRFGIDPHPRAADELPKRLGAATYTLQYPNKKEPGTYETPVTAIIANLTSPTAAGEQAKLTPYDVRVLFHEFGHVAHITFAQTETVRLAGDNNIHEDFRELVSVFFEKMADDPNTLRHLSGGAIPDDLADAYAKAQRIESLLMVQRNLRYGVLDLAIHTISEELAVDDLDAFRLRAEEFSGLREGEVGAGWPASFRHALLSRYAGRMQVYTLAAEKALLIHGLLGEVGDSGTRRQLGQVFRTMMERGGADRGSELLEVFLQRAQRVIQEAKVHRGLGAKAAESAQP